MDSFREINIWLNCRIARFSSPITVLIPLSPLPGLHTLHGSSESDQFSALCKSGDQFLLPCDIPRIFRSLSLSTLFSIPLKVVCKFLYFLFLCLIICHRLPPFLHDKRQPTMDCPNKRKSSKSFKTIIFIKRKQ